MSSVAQTLNIHPNKATRPVVGCSNKKKPAPEDCETGTYGEMEDRCKQRGKTAHHMVPDHCFRSKGDGEYFKDHNGDDVMSHKDGLCICLEGSGKHNTKDSPKVSTVRADDYGKGSAYNKQAHFDALAEHGQVHMLFDLDEDLLSLDESTPKGAATLGGLEDTAAINISDVTGCNPDELKSAMQDHHESKGLDSDTLLRANAKNSKVIPDPDNSVLVRLGKGTSARSGDRN